MPNKKTKQPFNAVITLVQIAQQLRGSQYDILGCYDPSLAILGDDERLQQRQYDRHSCDQEDESVEPVLTETLKSNINRLSSFLGTKPIETLLFVAIFVCHNSDKSVDIQNICDFFNFEQIHFLPLKKVVESLIEKELVEESDTNSYNQDCYEVTQDADEAITNNTHIQFSRQDDEVKSIDRYEFCEHINAYIEEHCRAGISAQGVQDAMLEMEAEYQDMAFVKSTLQLLPRQQDRLVFYNVCYRYIGHPGEIYVVDELLNKMFHADSTRLALGMTICDRTNDLVKNGLVTVLIGNGFYKEIRMKLSEKGKELFYEDNYKFFKSEDGKDGLSSQNGCESGNKVKSEVKNSKSPKWGRKLTRPDKILDRQLFFNGELSGHIELLKECLAEDNFAQVQSRLKECKLPTGVCVLMHGLPGTGKTASAEMLAKITGRSIYHVDIASSKCKWFGESERLFKKIFDDYRRMCETEELKPILLFNEADALFSRRIDIDAHNCAQIENTLQNILLEEMEVFEGILIATTNLIKNLDSAFERRFLFKIKFGQPDVQCRAAIWRSKVNWFSDDECQELASDYDLSGGEIDNIVRKSQMQYVLRGNYPDLQQVKIWCGSEKMVTDSAVRIGF